MSANAISSPTSDLISCAICRSRRPKSVTGYAAPFAGAYCCGFAAFSIFTASNVSLPVAWITSARPVRYSASRRSACPPVARTVNSSSEFIATTGLGPSSMRGICGVSDTALNGFGAHVAPASHVPDTAR